MAQVLSFPENEANAVTLTVGDVDRLNEGEFLNDSLIDFWCVRQWVYHICSKSVHT